MSDPRRDEYGIILDSVIDTPEFQAVWKLIKNWDVEHERGEGYSGTTGDDVLAILDAVAAA